MTARVAYPSLRDTQPSESAREISTWMVRRETFSLRHCLMEVFASGYCRFTVLLFNGALLTEANGVVRIANQGLPASVSDSGGVELECSVVSYAWSKDDGTLSSPGAHSVVFIGLALTTSNSCALTCGVLCNSHCGARGHVPNCDLHRDGVMT